MVRGEDSVQVIFEEALICGQSMPVMGITCSQSGVQEQRFLEVTPCVRAAITYCNAKNGRTLERQPYSLL